MDHRGRGEAGAAGAPPSFMEYSFAGLNPASESSQGRLSARSYGSATLRTETKDVPLQVPPGCGIMSKRLNGTITYIDAMCNLLRHPKSPENTKSIRES